MTFNQAFAIRVREILKEKHLKQSYIEKAAGIYYSTLDNILNGKTNASNFKTLALIIKCLGLSLTEFFDSEVFNLDNIILD